MMKIGDLAKRTDTPVETIRFYEREGLLPAPARTTGNYRSYDDGHAERLSFIRHCRGLDMALDEIRALLHYKDHPQDDCTEVNALLDEHIGHVAQRIRDLKALERQLKTLRASCRQSRDTAHCGILNQLSSPTLDASMSPITDAHVLGTHGRRTRPLQG